MTLRKHRPPRPTRRKCRTGKVRYRTEFEAQHVLKVKRVPLEDPDRPMPEREYYCDFCAGWHLTSSPWRGKLRCACCGATGDERHQLSCETVSPEEYFARTGGQSRSQS